MKKQSNDSNKSVRILKKSVPHRTVGGVNVQHFNSSAVEYESYNERNTISLLSLCHDVVGIRSQPITFNYLDDLGKHRKHIPDFEVTLDSGELLYLEVKAIEDLLSPVNTEKYARIAKEYFRLNFNFRFLTNIQIESQPIFEVVKLLTRYINSPVSDECLKLSQKLLDSDAMTIRNFMKEAQIDLTAVYTLIAKRHIVFDLNKVLSPDSYISLPNQLFEGITLEATLRSTRFGDLLQKLALGHQPTDQSLMATAKNWRQSDNHAGVWGVVGGFTKLAPLGDASKSGFLRSPKRRRAFAPGFYNPPTAC